MASVLPNGASEVFCTTTTAPITCCLPSLESSKASKNNRHADVLPMSDSPNDLILGYTADGVRRSIEGSLQRMRVSHLDIAYVHDLLPDFPYHPNGWKKA